MTWSLTQDAQLFADLTWPLLAARPVESTLALTVVDRLRSGRYRLQPPPVLCWYQEDAGTVEGAVVLTPPRSAILAEVPAGTVEDLATTLAAHGAVVPGVTGEERTVSAFVGVWTRRRGYGTAVTAACTLDALRRGADDVVLFTDRANRTSNDIYRQLGFRPVHDCTLVDLEPVHG